MRTGLIPGSFDPLHNGHLMVVETASRLFERVVVAAVRNPGKEPRVNQAGRQEMLVESMAHLDNVETTSFSGLVVDLANEVGATAIVKGLRAVSDLENELQMAQMNRAMSGIDTILIPPTSGSSFIASKFIKDFARGGRDVSDMVPEPVAKRIREKYAK
jgi:pantetheine-phosphate adenylyltransferase